MSTGLHAYASYRGHPNPVAFVQVHGHTTDALPMVSNRSVLAVNTATSAGETEYAPFGMPLQPKSATFVPEAAMEHRESSPQGAAASVPLAKPSAAPLADGAAPAAPVIKCNECGRVFSRRAHLGR
jgi:hypothetical protein